jgi:glycosyltransferase involved in cell wall biosynthesis
MTTTGTPRRRTTVLFVDHESRLSGGQHDLLDLVRALDPERVAVHVALPEQGPLEDGLRGAGATIHRLPMGRALRRLSRWQLVRRPDLVIRHAAAFIAASVRLHRIIRRLRPDVVHTNSMKSHLLAAVPARKRRVPLVWHVRDVLEAGWLSRAFVAAGSRYPARIVCLSKVAGLQFAGSPAAAKVRVVYNGIHLDRFSGRRSAEWRARLGAQNGEVVVGMVGQIAHWKGQDVFIDAAKRVARVDPHVRFAVVGECLFPENESGFASEMRERSRALEDRIVWTGWCDDSAAVMSAFDVLVHASRLPEPFGRVIVEGMAAGTPVVASTAGAGPEILPHSAGRLVVPGDAAALADTLLEMIRDPDARAQAGAAGRDAARRFDIAQTAAGVMAVYEELVPWCA